MLFDLLLPLRNFRLPVVATASAQVVPHDDFRDTEPSLFWLDSRPLPAEAREATRPLVRRPVTMARC